MTISAGSVHLPDDVLVNGGKAFDADDLQEIAEFQIEVFVSVSCYCQPAGKVFVCLYHLHIAGKVDKLFQTPVVIRGFLQTLQMIDQFPEMAVRQGEAKVIQFCPLVFAEGMLCKLF